VPAGELDKVSVLTYSDEGRHSVAAHQGIVEQKQLRSEEGRRQQMAVTGKPGTWLLLCYRTVYRK